MKSNEIEARPRETFSDTARQRLLCRRGEPMFLAAWERALIIHFEVDADALQRDVPYELDLLDGRAFVSLVAFTMRGMKPRIGGRLGEWLFRPISTHDFLNVRTYVRHGGESGIHFIAEWLSSWLASKFGPATFGLPYRHGCIAYDHDWRRGHLSGRVVDALTVQEFSYNAWPDAGTPIEFATCKNGSQDEWLMERYTAFNSAGGRKRFFRVWHPPWSQCRMDVEVREDTLLKQNWSWFGDARLIGANFSPGLREVWMGHAHRISKA